MSNNPLGKAIKDFLAESEEIINQLSLELVKLSDCADRGDYDPDVVNSIFRSAHSLKGLAGMFGFTGIADLAHNLENLLDLLRLGKIPLEESAVTILFDSLAPNALPWRHRIYRTFSEQTNRYYLVALASLFCLAVIINKQVHSFAQLRRQVFVQLLSKLEEPVHNASRIPHLGGLGVQLFVIVHIQHVQGVFTLRPV